MQPKVLHLVATFMLAFGKGGQTCDGVLDSQDSAAPLSPRIMSAAQDYLFRGIQKSEWANLFEFIQAKRLRVENLDEAAGGPGGGRALDLGDDIDTGATRALVTLAKHDASAKGVT